MNQNPFVPSFSTAPKSFFGRDEYLRRYASALEASDSADRFMFLTGTRGSGKTSLLYQYERIAKEHRWDVIRATNLNALDALADYAGLATELTYSRALKPEISVPHVFSASLGEIRHGTAKPAEPITMLGIRLAEQLSGEILTGGLAVIVDEAQKLDHFPAVVISQAIQELRTEGIPVSLVYASLPNGFRKLRNYPDVTFTKRMKREYLWPMPKGETISFLIHAFSQLPEFEVSRDLLMEMASFSGGHPYLAQLVGDRLYRIVQRELDPPDGAKIKISASMVAQAEDSALAEYKQNVLDDLLHSCRGKTREYIEKAYELRGADGHANTDEIDRAMGRNSRENASTRSYALSTQVIRKAGFKSVRFALPHYRYIFKPFDYEEESSAADEWDYR